MKSKTLTTPGQLKKLATSIKELAFMLEDATNLKCLQSAKVEIKKNNNRDSLASLEFSVRLDIFEEGDFKEVAEFLEGVK